MKTFLAWTTCLLSFSIQAIEYEVQFENEKVHVARAKIMPYEVVGLHRDAYTQVVIALQGGTITRLEADGTTTDVNFPTATAVFTEVDPPNEFHNSVNNTSDPIELIIIQLKDSINAD